MNLKIIAILIAIVVASFATSPVLLLSQQQ